jgi:hypothetical protein
MIDVKDGALTSKDLSFRIGPALTRPEFRSADWGQGATTVVNNAPWHSWKLGGKYCSMSMSFIVILYFYGEQLVQIELCHSDGTFGKSWADYSTANEQRRKESHDAWLVACCGSQRSFPWGSVSSEDGDDPHGGGSASILIRYNSFPIQPQRATAASPGTAIARATARQWHTAT